MVRSPNRQEWCLGSHPPRRGGTPVRGDRVQLQQVVLNLILNAVEAMGVGRESAHESYRSTPSKASRADVLITIRDSGPGIDQNILQQVFHPSTPPRQAVSEWGLSICRSIIDAHGGRLWADANQPRGRVFQFTLPAAQEGLMNSPQAAYPALESRNEDNARDNHHPPAC